jgi:hypothetical protein
MSVIIDRCPFHDVETAVETPSGALPVRAYQIIVWVGVSLRGSVSRPFPAVLDTGHSHNFSITDEQMQKWTGWEPNAMRRIGTARVNNRVVALREADLVLFPNAAGKRDELSGKPHLLELSQGIVIASQGDPFATRLPALGMRALVRNGMRVVVDGAAKTVSLEAQR